MSPRERERPGTKRQTPGSVDMERSPAHHLLEGQTS